MPRYDVNGEYRIRYRSEMESGREIVTDVVGYENADGTPVSREELEKDYVVMTDDQLQEEIDEQNFGGGCQCRGHCYC